MLIENSIYLFIIMILVIIGFLIVIYYRKNIKAYLKNDIISVICNDLIIESIKNKKNTNFFYKNLYNMNYNKKLGSIIGIQEIKDSDNNNQFLLIYIKSGYFNFIKKYFYLVEKNYFVNDSESDLIIDTKNLIGINLTYEDKNIFYTQEDNTDLLLGLLNYTLSIKKLCNNVNLSYEIKKTNIDQFIHNTGIQISKKQFNLNDFNIKK